MLMPVYLFKFIFQEFEDEHLICCVAIEFDPTQWHLRLDSCLPSVHERCWRALRSRVIALT